MLAGHDVTPQYASGSVGERQGSAGAARWLPGVLLPLHAGPLPSPGRAWGNTVLPNVQHSGYQGSSPGVYGRHSGVIEVCQCIRGMHRVLTGVVARKSSATCRPRAARVLTGIIVRPSMPARRVRHGNGAVQGVLMHQGHACIGPLSTSPDVVPQAARHPPVALNCPGLLLPLRCSDHRGTATGSPVPTSIPCPFAELVNRVRRTTTNRK